MAIRSQIRVIVAGGREYSDWATAEKYLKMLILPLSNGADIEIVSGCCHIGVHTFTRKDGTKVYGADGLGERFAEENNLPVKYFPANWVKHGRAAGPIRNRQMAEYASHCVVFWDGKSKGAKNMIDRAIANDFILFIKRY